MARSLTDRLERISLGHRVRLDQLAELHKELTAASQQVLELAADLEQASEQFGDWAEQLADRETPNGDRRELWTLLIDEADNARVAMKAIAGWHGP